MDHDNPIYLRTKFTVESWVQNSDRSLNVTFATAGVAGVPHDRSYMAILPQGKLTLIVPADSCFAEDETIKKGKTFYFDLIPAEEASAVGRT